MKFNKLPIIREIKLIYLFSILTLLIGCPAFDCYATEREEKDLNPSATLSLLKKINSNPSSSFEGEILCNISALEVVTTRLSAGMSAPHKWRLKKELSTIEVGHLTSIFEEVAMRLSAGIYGEHKLTVISILGSISADQLNNFEALVNRLSGGISYDRYEVIKALGNIEPERLTPTFDAVVNRLFVWIEERHYNCNKNTIISLIGNTEPEHLTSAFELLVREHLEAGATML